MQLVALVQERLRSIVCSYFIGFSPPSYPVARPPRTKSKKFWTTKVKPLTNLKAAGYRWTDEKTDVSLKEGNDLCAGQSSGPHFKGGSDTMSEEFTKLLYPWTTCRQTRLI